MSVNFTGKVFLANGAPLSGVQVRIFDKDEPGQGDDDLTLTPGLSAVDGGFTVSFEPSRYLDMGFLGGLSSLGLPIHLQAISRSLPFLGPPDVLLPYLQFTYTIGGRSRQHTTPLVPFQDEFYLPELPALDFTPSHHGFKFLNSFPGYPLPFSVPALPGFASVTGAYGLCGGMSSAAYDFLLAGRDIPRARAVPAQGSPLQQYLYRRQVDSMGALGEALVKVATWMRLPDDTPHGAYKHTYDEFEQVRLRLDDRNAVVLALIYEKAETPAEVPQKICNNHQVLATGYSQPSGDTLEIHIYDPNYPGRDDTSIQAERVTVGSLLSSGRFPTTVWGFKSVQKIPGQPDREVHGFFPMPYSPVLPPTGL